HEDRIDDERPRRIVGPNLERNVTAVLEQITSGDLLSAAVDLLVDDRLLQSNGIGAGFEHEVAAIVDSPRLRTLERQTDALRVGAGRHDEVVFELTLVAVVDEVHT